MKNLSTHKNRFRTLLISGLAVSALVGAMPATAFAQDHRGDAPGAEHSGWGADRGSGYTYRNGERMGYNDWNNAPVVDYRAEHLHRPRAGYEWREHNGHYVMAAVATGLVASVVLGHH
jgi:Ni/Co efflux regulator RcnB